MDKFWKVANYAVPAMLIGVYLFSVFNPSTTKQEMLLYYGGALLCYLLEWWSAKGRMV